MKETTRTLVFVVAAAVSAAGAAAAHWLTRPAEIAGFEKVGEEFFKDFRNPNAAKALRVVAYNEDTATIREFEVEFANGVWRIPSRHNYPADAEDRLANTAASVIGIERGALASRREADHERYGVIDPLDDDATALKGRGQRITLSDEKGQVLADYIIGKPVENRDGYYYVRHPKEKETYLTKLEIDLSTKFADWIEADLLKLDRDKLAQIVVDKYSIDESQGAIVDKEVSTLTRDAFSAPWRLDGLDEQTEEVNTDAVRELVNRLDDLKIVGVRPKPKGINADLTIDSRQVKSQLLLEALRNEMADKGFLIAAGEQGEPRLYSKEGEVIASTNEGVEYALHFGNIFTGSDLEVEVGFAADKAKQDAERSQSKTDDDSGQKKPANEETAGGEAPQDASKSSLNRSRYLFVSTHFNPGLLGEPPVEPAKPEKPQSTSEPSPADEAATAETPATADDAKDKNAADEEAKPAEKSPEEQYQAALAQYEQDLEKYRNDLTLYEDKVEQGKKTVEELNRRFGEWYYVISAESFETLRLSRKDLVKPKEEPNEEKPADEAAGNVPLDNPILQPPAEPAAPDSKSADEADEPEESAKADKEPAESSPPQKPNAAPSDS